MCATHHHPHCKPQLLLKCQEVACPAGWEFCTQHRNSSQPLRALDRSPDGKAEERPCKLSLILDLLLLPKLQPQHHQGLQASQRGTAFKTGWPQKKAAVMLIPRVPGPGREDRVMQKEMLLNWSLLSTPSFELRDVIQALCQGQCCTRDILSTISDTSW